MEKENHHETSKPARLCPRCKERPLAKGQSYCRICNRAYKREWSKGKYLRWINGVRLEPEPRLRDSDVPPVSMVYEEASTQLFLHGRCKRVLMRLGLGTNPGGHRELQFFCIHCVEHVILPEVMLPRITPFAVSEPMPAGAA